MVSVRHAGHTPRKRSSSPYLLPPPLSHRLPTADHRLRTSRPTITFSFALLILFAIRRVIANHPPQFLTGAQTEIVLRLKEGADTPVGKYTYTY